jgi:hypothetical protein
MVLIGVLLLGQQDPLISTYRSILDTSFLCKELPRPRGQALASLENWGLKL